MPDAGAQSTDRQVLFVTRQLDLGNVTGNARGHDDPGEYAFFRPLAGRERRRNGPKRSVARPADLRCLPYRGTQDADWWLVIADRLVTPITAVATYSRQSRHSDDRVGLLKDVNVLTTQNPVNLGNLTNIRSLDAVRLTARAWGLLLAVVHGMASTGAPGPNAADRQVRNDHGMARMLAGAERC
jgi:hypothetical protein